MGHAVKSFILLALSVIVTRAAVPPSVIDFGDSSNAIDNGPNRGFGEAINFGAVPEEGGGGSNPNEISGGGSFGPGYGETERLSGGGPSGGGPPPLIMKGRVIREGSLCYVSGDDQRFPCKQTGTHKYAGKIRFWSPTKNPTAPFDIPYYINVTHNWGK